MPKARKPNKPTQPQRLELRGHAAISAASAPGEPAKPRTFRMVANTGEPMRLWGFSQPVVVDLASVDLSGLPVPALYDHYPEIDHAVGQVQAARIAGSELVAEGVFTVTDTGDPDRNYAKKVLDKADAGYQWQVSVGGDPATVEEVKAGQSAQVNGRTYPGPVCVARGLTLREISFVVLGADRKTSAVVAGSKGSKMKFEDYVKSLAFDPATLSAEATAALQKVYAEEYPEDEDEDEEEVEAAEDDAEDDKEEKPPTSAAAKPVKLTAADKLAVVNRIKEIISLCGKYEHPDYTYTSEVGEQVKAKLSDYAVEHDWTVDKVKATLLDIERGKRGKAPAAIVKSDNRETRLAAMQAGLLMQVGGRVDYQFKKRPVAAQLYFGKTAPWLLANTNDAGRDRVMNAGARYASYSALDLCREALRLDGGDPAGMDSEDIIRAALRPQSVGLKAASSGSALSYIFSTSVHAQLLASYEQSEDTTAGWVSEAEVANFQTQERTRVDIGGGLKLLPRGKSAEHADYADSQETYRAHRFAKQFVADEQDMMSDNLNGLATVPGEFGKAAARLRPDMVYYVLLSNPTLGATARQLFNTTDGNLTASGAALSAANLTSGIGIMAKFRENSVNLNLRATHLLVPPETEMLARELTQSSLLMTGSDTVRGSTNVLALQGIVPVMDARLSNGVTDPITGSSGSGDTDAWFLVSTQAHTIEVGYLRGTGRAPKVRSKVLDEGRWGMQWDVVMDIGVCPLDWRGFYKSAGA